MVHRHTHPRQGESAPFHFETTWRVHAEAEQVWRVLSDISSWPDWWPGMRTTRMRGSRERASLTVQSPLGYRLHFVVELACSEPPTSAELAVDGDLRGEGSFTARQDAGGTRLTIMWCVVTRRRLIRAARPVASWAHDLVMAAGERGLRRVCEQSRARGRGSDPGLTVSPKALGGVLVLVSGGLIGGRYGCGPAASVAQQGNRKRSRWGRSGGWAGVDKRRLAGVVVRLTVTAWAGTPRPWHTTPLPPMLGRIRRGTKPRILLGRRQSPWLMKSRRKMS